MVPALSGTDPPDFRCQHQVLGPTSWDVDVLPVPASYARFGAVVIGAMVLCWCAGPLVTDFKRQQIWSVFIDY